MCKHRKHLLVKAVALLVAVVFICPFYARAVESRASEYLTSYNAYPYAAGLGRVQIWFNVTADAYMDDLGALSIQIFESTDNTNWTWVKTFTQDKTAGMLAQNEIFYQGHVEYQGVIGRYYKAYVCIWAGRDGGGDTRYFWTGPIKATLFAG